MKTVTSVYGVDQYLCALQTSQHDVQHKHSFAGSPSSGRSHTFGNQMTKPCRVEVAQILMDGARKVEGHRNVGPRKERVYGSSCSSSGHCQVCLVRVFGAVQVWHFCLSSFSYSPDDHYGEEWPLRRAVYSQSSS